MDLEDQYHFQVEAAAREDAQLWLTCDRCPWEVVFDQPISLAELNQKAAEHAAEHASTGR